MKLGHRSRSGENLAPPSSSSGGSTSVNARSDSPPLSLAAAGRSPSTVEGNRIPISPFDTPPKKTWEHNFRSFLSKRSNQLSSSAAAAPVFPPVPTMAPLHQQHRQQQPQPQQQPQQQPQPIQAKDKSPSSRNKLFKGTDQNNNKFSSNHDKQSDSSVRGGKFFSSMFGSGSGSSSGQSQKKANRKTKSVNDLDSTMRNGYDKVQRSPSSQHMQHKVLAVTADPRRAQSHTNFNTLVQVASIEESAVYNNNNNNTTNGMDGGGGDDELNRSRRRATYAGTTTGASMIPAPLHQPHQISPPDHARQQHFLQQQQQHFNPVDPHLVSNSSSSNSKSNNPANISNTAYPNDVQQLPQMLPMSLNRGQQPIPAVPQQHYQDHHPQPQELLSLQPQQQHPQQHHQYQHQHHHLIPPQQSQQHHLIMNPLGPPQALAMPSSSNNGMHFPSQQSASSQLNSQPQMQPHAMCPSSATTEIKKAFTEFHNSSLYANDSTSPYLGDEPSTRPGDAHYSMYNPGLVAQNQFEPGMHSRNYSQGSITLNSGSGSGRFLSSSLPTVDENVSIHKSMRMLRPFQAVENWQQGRRYLVGPATMAACPLLQGIATVSLSTASNTRDNEALQEVNSGDATGNDKETKDDPPSNNIVAIESPTELPPLFGCIVLGKALLSYVVTEPMHQHQQRWWSSSILVLRQNYLLEYDQQTGDVLHGLPRGYAHLEFSKSYAHADFADALELEFFVSPCAKADRRVLTIRLEEAREKRDNWIACLNRAAQLEINDLYEFDDSVELGRGRYAGVYPAKRKGQSMQGTKDNSSSAENNKPMKKKSLSAQIFPKMSLENRDCALKIIDKKEFWRRVVKDRERGDTLVREVSVQATMTTKCPKIPAFTRIRGFLETSDSVVLELELLEGVDLFQYVSSKGVLPEKESALIIRDILSVLAAMNRVGLAHRDIKPANCLMCKTGETSSLDDSPCVVKVADFGMATFVGVDGLVRGRCGTPGYVAPEIFSAGLHGGYGNKIDVFSAGVTLYVMLCGYEPFYGESDADLVAANKEAKLEFPSTDWRQVSLGAKDLVKRMMEPDPQQRLSAKEALEHSWIINHAGKIESASVAGTITGVDALSESLHKMDGACVIS